MMPRSPGALQYDGMRHVFVVVPVLAVLAGLGFGWVLDLARGLRHGVWWRGVLITGVPLWLLWQNAQAHPYQGSYLNEVVRAVLPARELADHFDFHSWGTPLHHGVRWLNARPAVGLWGDGVGAAARVGPILVALRVGRVGRADPSDPGVLWHGDIAHRQCCLGAGHGQMAASTLLVGRRQAARDAHFG
jgi:hypothetical protein